MTDLPREGLAFINMSPPAESTVGQIPSRNHFYRTREQIGTGRLIGMLAVMRVRQAELTIEANLPISSISKAPPGTGISTIRSIMLRAASRASWPAGPACRAS